MRAAVELRALHAVARLVEAGLDETVGAGSAAGCGAAVGVLHRAARVLEILGMKQRHATRTRLALFWRLVGCTQCPTLRVVGEWSAAGASSIDDVAVISRLQNVWAIIFEAR